LIAHKEVGTPEAGLELLDQPTFDAPHIILVKMLWGQIRDVVGLIRVEEAAQCHGHMTGIAVHRPPNEGLDVAHQVVIRGEPIPRFLAGSQAFLVAFARV
jgi:hypothetical protein